MNLLLVDDQISVLDGLKSSIPFSRYGIRKIFTATNADDARAVIQSHPVDLMLSDIEMPGENGLSLNKWVKEHYPAILRVLLTSHASFRYAQEGVKLGCFDYIVQPATKEEIGDVLSRATAQIAKSRQYSLYQNNLYMSSMVESLFSQNESDRIMAQKTLTERGYALKSDTLLRTVIINLYPYQDEHSSFKPEYDIFTILLNVASFTFTASGVVPLVCKNRYRQFVLLLFSNDNSVAAIDTALYRTFYDTLAEVVSPELTCYVSVLGTLASIREVILSAHVLFQQDVIKKKDIFFPASNAEENTNRNLSENISRWRRLLDNNQYEAVENNIYAYLDYHASTGQLNFDTLCEFHQEISKIFFMYLYQQNMNVSDIFTAAYTYADFMNCCRDLQSLKKGVTFIVRQIAACCGTDTDQDPVQRAKAYILANLSNDISVKDVAEHIHLNPEYFSKLFKKEMGENVKNYMLRIKVDAAKDMLENTNIPVSIVSLELGYSNFSHFTQMFKKHEGITPSEYRKTFAQKQADTPPEE